MFTKRFSFKDARGEAVAEFKVDVNNVLQSDVLLTYAPYIISGHKRPGVIRLPKKLVEQLRGIPDEMHGVPIDVLIRISQGIGEDEGKSIIEELGKQDGHKLNISNQ